MNLTVARYSLTGDVPGVPPVGWIADRRRCSFEHAATMHGQCVRLVERHGLDALLTVDVVDLDDLHGVGRTWQRHRHLAQRAQRLLHDFNGVTA